MTLDELRRHDGTSAEHPLRLAIRGVIFDVEPGGAFYGPGGPYHVFAGRECARALARNSLHELDLTDDLRGLDRAELDALAQWTAQFRAKYRVVGEIEPAT